MRLAKRFQHFEYFDLITYHRSMFHTLTSVTPLFSYFQKRIRQLYAVFEFQFQQLRLLTFNCPFYFVYGFFSAESTSLWNGSWPQFLCMSTLFGERIFSVSYLYICTCNITKNSLILVDTGIKRKRNRQKPF